MARVGDNGRYGVVVMQSVDGTWWWSRLLQTIDLVPMGLQRSVITLHLTERQNDPNGVMRALARWILKHW